MSALQNYLTLVQRVDQLCASTQARFQNEISCRPGCDACCRHLSIFAVEAAALEEALAAASDEEAAVIRDAARGAGEEGRCPLLQDGLCLLYQARPIICRTHGLPLLISREGENSVDFCPENFQGVTSIPGDAIIDLERLNAMLTAINALFLQSSPGPERITLAEALLRQSR